MYPDAEMAIRADQTALGTIPAKAMRYCEPIRSASAFGWYVFAARPVSLLFDGSDVFIDIDSNWEVLTTEHASDPDSWWNTYCPDNLHDMAPPFITSIGAPGYVQIWSGLLVQTKKDWSTLIRPVANTAISGQFFCFEGIIETDHYAPAPLFINMRLLPTNVPIPIPSDEPLFQVQPIHRSCYSNETLGSMTVDEAENMSNDDWLGYRKTIRSNARDADDHETGQYAVETRKRAKRKT